MQTFLVKLPQIHQEVKLESEEKELANWKPALKSFAEKFIFLGRFQNLSKEAKNSLIVKFKDYKREIKVEYTSDSLENYLSELYDYSLKFSFQTENSKSKSTLIVPLQNLQYIKFCSNGTTKMLLLNKNLSYSVT